MTTGSLGGTLSGGLYDGALGGIYGAAGGAVFYGAGRGLGLIRRTGLASARGLGTAGVSRPYSIDVSRPAMTVADAEALAAKHGIRIPSNVGMEVVEADMLPNAYAQWASYEINPNEWYRFSDLMGGNGKINILLRQDVLHSEEAVLGTLKHEIFEIRYTRFATRNGPISGEQLHGMLNGNRSIGPVGNVHNRAVEIEERFRMLKYPE